MSTHIKNALEAQTPETGDQVHYREYKILLSADHFSKPAAFRRLWKSIRHTGKKLNIDLAEHDDPYEKHYREVLFYDTPQFDLYNNSFILRLRTFIKHGVRENNHELTFKFRHSDPQTAAAVNVHPAMPLLYRVKFKEEILLLRDQLGGMRSLYSHGCEMESPNLTLNVELGELARVFPALEKINADPKQRLEVVNNLSIEERLVNLGDIDFGGGAAGKATAAVWRNSATGKDIVGEFAFQLKFNRQDDLHKQPKDRSELFYKFIQLEAHEMVHLGTTKTSLVYGLGKAPIRNSE